MSDDEKKKETRRFDRCAHDGIISATARAMRWRLTEDALAASVEIYAGAKKLALECLRTAILTLREEDKGEAFRLAYSVAAIASQSLRFDFPENSANEARAACEKSPVFEPFALAVESARDAFRMKEKLVKLRETISQES